MAHARHHEGGDLLASAGGKKMERLNLTPAQKSQVEQIQKNTRTQMQEVLTAEQKQKFKAAVAADANPIDAMRDMRSSLTPAQKEKMKAIRQSSKQQFKALLTPEQLKTMESSGSCRKSK
jgi:Spy/CpxP family protein refolding chaperone